MPGTRMAFPGLRDEQQRADVIAYIKANGGVAESEPEAE
jgi:cytochrome c